MYCKKCGAENVSGKFCRFCGAELEADFFGWDTFTVRYGLVDGCGMIQTRTLGEALGHDYAGAVTREATCTEEGVTTYTCSRCGISYGLPIEPLGHDWGEPEWTWEYDYSGAVATFTCEHDDSHTETATAAKIAYADRTYTATAVFEGETYTDTVGPVYSVSVDPAIAHGTVGVRVVVSHESGTSGTEPYTGPVLAGTEIEVSASADEGYGFKSWRITDGAGNEIAVGRDRIFTMPAGDVTVSAS